MVSAGALAAFLREALEAAGFDDAGFEAAQLMRIAGAPDARLDARAPVPQEAAESAKALLRRRLAHEPLQYLAGEWDFWDFTLRVGPGVLIPRADTELCAMLAAQKARAAGPGARVADLCAGSGAIALGVALHTDAKVTAVELSGEAWRYLEENNRLYGSPLTLVRADVLRWNETLADGAFDVIVSNPPYVTEREYAALAPELFAEPKMALVAGQRGLAFYRHIAPGYARALAAGGWLVFEIGETQAGDVTTLCRAAGYRDVAVHRDLAGQCRCVCARRP